VASWLCSRAGGSRGGDIAGGYSYIYDSDASTSSPNERLIHSSGDTSKEFQLIVGVVYRFGK
jgi:hypothetical protein